MVPTDTTRRSLLRLATAGSLLGLAGCLGGDDEGTDTETDQDDTETDQNDTETDGGDGHDHGGDVPDGPSATAEVKMIQGSGGSNHYSPHVVWVEKGGTVTFVMDSGNHSATAYTEENGQPRRIPEGAKSFDSGVLTEEGATFEHSFETEGVYDYYCTPHHGLGMIGSVIVGEPSPEGQPGLAPPQSDLPGDAGAAIEKRNETVKKALSGHGGDGHSEDETHSDDENHSDDDHHTDDGETKTNTSDDDHDHS
ncbi:plastocyanin/azurin family copper-binding protein [Haloarchaeobius sp. TZWWS8]|uniref:plastocyanin/azurin family copper-binding protein n=1 Tax=Haloarchaeobius sp. TZWWS8 TaxID=3446121 RepID=UPI003EBF4907